MTSPFLFFFLDTTSKIPNQVYTVNHQLPSAPIKDQFNSHTKFPLFVHSSFQISVQIEQPSPGCTRSSSSKTFSIQFLFTSYSAHHRHRELCFSTLSSPFLASAALQKLTWFHQTLEMIFLASILINKVKTSVAGQRSTFLTLWAANTTKILDARYGEEDLPPGHKIYCSCGSNLDKTTYNDAKRQIFNQVKEITPSNIPEHFRSTAIAGDALAFACSEDD